MKSEKLPLLSIRLMTYNHQAFIEDALNGIDIQKTDFKFELVIGDDFSTDNTLNIIKNFPFQNDNLNIRILERTRGDAYDKERKEKGRLFNFINIIENCLGKYIALLDGDDYWTDPLKLQKQLNFLKSNKDYGICFHNVTQTKSFNSLRKEVIPNVESACDFIMADYIMANRTASCSIVFCSKYFRSTPDWFFKVPFGDLGLIFYVLKNSNEKGRVLKDNMGVYRIHNNSTHGKFHINNRHLIDAYKEHLKFTRIITKKLLVEKKYEWFLLRKMESTYKVLSRLQLKENNIFQYLRNNIIYRFFKIKKRFIKSKGMID